MESERTTKNVMLVAHYIGEKTGITMIFPMKPLRTPILTTLVFLGKLLVALFIRTSDV